jgi:hypothetical protein
MHQEMDGLKLGFAYEAAMDSVAKRLPPLLTRA